LEEEVLEWIFNSSPEIIERMSREIGIESIEELFSDIPRDLVLRKDLKVGFGKRLSEYELLRQIDGYSKAILKPRIPPFAGIEFCIHYVPALVKYIIERGEFLTSYTPYHPEINQGVLQALFEYQCLMAELYGVEVVNASMYDGSTALAEAVRMALRITKRRKIVVSKGVSPIKRSVLKTWLRGVDVRIEEVQLTNGTLSAETLSSALDRDTACVVIENPNTFGVIETELGELIAEAHRVGALAIVFSNPIALGILKPPGDYGADIVVGEGAPLGLGLYYGGFTLGILGTRNDMKFIRQMPGRLVGMTVDAEGSKGFALVLQTREQHIRRERATSNITTNSALAAIASAVYVSLLGSDGLKRLALGIAARTRYLLHKLRDTLSSVDGVQIPLFNDVSYFMKIPVRIRNLGEVMKIVRERGILMGSNLGLYDPELRDICTICVTECHSRSDIDALIEELRKVLAHVEASSMG